MYICSGKVVLVFYFPAFLLFFFVRADPVPSVIPCNQAHGAADDGQENVDYNACHGGWINMIDGSTAPYNNTALWGRATLGFVDGNDVGIASLRDIEFQIYAHSVYSNLFKYAILECCAEATYHKNGKK